MPFDLNAFGECRRAFRRGGGADHARAGGAERQGDGMTDAARGAGDESEVVVECGHGSGTFRRGKGGIE